MAFDGIGARKDSMERIKFEAGVRIRGEYQSPKVICGKRVSGETGDMGKSE
jgi:hypothetical protein